MSEAPKLDPAETISLAWQPRATRLVLASLFALDRRVAGVVSRAREPMLAQVRLAWWRERLSDALANANAGEPLITELAACWGHHARGLHHVVDGWEALLGDAPLDEAALNAFADGRGRALAAFAEVAGPAEEGAAALVAGRTWAFADLATRSSHAGERTLARSLGRDEPDLRIGSRSLRGIAVLGGLSRRALDRGEPLMEGRGGAVAAMRLGLFGR
jgi:phytoene synthase